MKRTLKLAAILVLACAPLARSEGGAPGTQVAPSQVRVIVMAAWAPSWLCQIAGGWFASLCPRSAAETVRPVVDVQPGTSRP